MSKNLFVDMDGTLAVWRQAASMEELYQPGFFRMAEEHPNVVKAIRELKDGGKGYNVYILSACIDSPYAESEKREWLDRVGLFPPDSENILLCPMGVSKAQYIEQRFGRQLSKDDVLLDDYSVNLHDWVEHGGTGIKVLNDVNGTHGTWKGPEFPVEYQAQDIITFLEAVLGADGEFF